MLEILDPAGAVTMVIPAIPASPRHLRPNRRIAAGQPFPGIHAQMIGTVRTRRVARDAGMPVRSRRWTA